MKEKIKQEKRRRHQIYMTMDYLLSAITFFDFFSKDAFKIISDSKIYTKLASNNEITSEFLLLPFLSSKLKIGKILKNYGIDENEIGIKISQNNNLIKKSSFFNLKKFFPFIFNKQVITIDSVINLDFSKEVNNLFEKASENALLRFKTPIISSEILFITIMEEKNTKAAKLIKNELINDVEWYMLRYKLLKELHNHETNVRSEVSKNQQYFAYLLKSRLSEAEFDLLIQKEILPNAVSLFRNILVSDMLQVNLFNLLTVEINKSNKVNNKRTYSS